MGRAWDHSADNAASMGMQLAETAAVWSKLAVVPASSTGSTWDGPRSALGLKPKRVPHMARSTVVDDDRARERRDASDLQTPSPMQSMTGCRARLPRTGLRHAYNNMDLLPRDAPAGQLQMRTKQRLIPKIATALVRLRHRLERKQRLHQILNDHIKVSIDPLPHPDLHRRMWNVSWTLEMSRGSFPRVHRSLYLSGAWSYEMSSTTGTGAVPTIVARTMKITTGAGAAYQASAGAGVGAA